MDTLVWSLLYLFLSHPGSPEAILAGHYTRVSTGSKFQLWGFSFKPLANQLRIVNVRSGLTLTLVVPNLPPLCAPDPPGHRWLVDNRGEDTFYL